MSTRRHKFRGHAFKLLGILIVGFFGIVIESDRAKGQELSRFWEDYNKLWYAQDIAGAFNLGRQYLEGGSLQDPAVKSIVALEIAEDALNLYLNDEITEFYLLAGNALQSVTEENQYFLPLLYKHQVFGAKWLLRTADHETAKKFIDELFAIEHFDASILPQTYIDALLVKAQIELFLGNKWLADSLVYQALAHTYLQQDLDPKLVLKVFFGMAEYYSAAGNVYLAAQFYDRYLQIVNDFSISFISEFPYFASRLLWLVIFTGQADTEYAKAVSDAGDLFLSSSNIELPVIKIDFYNSQALYFAETRQLQKMEAALDIVKGEIKKLGVTSKDVLAYISLIRARGQQNAGQKVANFGRIKIGDLGDLTREGLTPYFYYFLSQIALQEGNWKKGTSLARKGAEGLFQRMSDRSVTGGLKKVRFSNLENIIFIQYIKTLFPLLEQNPNDPKINSEVFKISQINHLLETSTTIADEIAALTISDPIDRQASHAISNLISARVQLSQTLADELLVRLKTDQGPARHLDNVNYAYVVTAKEISNHSAHLNKKYPDFQLEDRLLMSSYDEVANLLRGDEALVFHAFFDDWLVVGCIGDREISKVIRVDAEELTIAHNTMRNAVIANHSPSKELDSTFPLDEAAYLYDLLFSPLESCFENKKNIFINTDPDLYGIPFNALVLNPPAGGTAHTKLDQIEWLGLQYNLAFLPKPSLLKLTRNPVKWERPPKQFLGFGDPLLGKESDQKIKLLASSLFTQRGIGNAELISQLTSLPETREELLLNAEAFGGSLDDLYFQERATESNFYVSGASEFKVISFATHGLVAGQFEGVVEPALVLTPGAEETTFNDGLLTASEIRQLQLRTDLIILSACNTATDSGESNFIGLSDLTDSFLSAGAKSLAVTQWSVHSLFAKEITTLTIKELNNGETSTSGALRTAMAQIIATSKNEAYFHPRFWAPFIIIGDGFIRPSTGPAPKEALKEEWDLKLGEPGFRDESFSVKYWKSKDAFVVAGNTQSEFKNREQAGANLLLITPEGEVVWSRTNPDFLAPRVIAIFENDTFLLLGQTFKNNKKGGIFIGRFNDQGDVITEYYLDSPLHEKIHSSKFVENELFFLVEESDIEEVVKDGIYNSNFKLYKFSLDMFDTTLVGVIPTHLLVEHPYDDRFVFDTISSAKIFHFPGSDTIGIALNGHISGGSKYLKDYGATLTGCSKVYSLIYDFSLDDSPFQKVGYLEDFIIDTFINNQTGSYFVGRETQECSWESNIVIRKVSPDFKTREIKKFSYPFGQHPIDSKFTETGELIIVGQSSVRMSLGQALAKQYTLEENPNFDEETLNYNYWFESGASASAFIMFLDKKFNLIDLRLKEDRLLGTFNSLDLNQSSDFIVTAGISGGHQARVIGFSLENVAE